MPELFNRPARPEPASGGLYGCGMLYHLIVMAEWRGGKTSLPVWYVPAGKGGAWPLQCAHPAQPASGGSMLDDTYKITEDKDNIVMFQDHKFTGGGVARHLWSVCKGLPGRAAWRRNPMPVLL